MFHRKTRSAPVRRALGIDIGRHAVKIIVLEEAAEGVAVTHAARLPTPAGTVSDGEVVGRRELSDCIYAALRESGCPLRSAALAIPTPHVLLRWIDLPQMDPESLRAASRFEARKYLSYSPDLAEVQIVPMEQTGVEEEGRMKALLAAAPTAIVRSYADAVETAGLEVACIQPEPLALLRIQNANRHKQGELWRGQPVAYVHLGESGSGICVFQDARLRFVRAISWGGARLSETLAEALECSREEASALKERDDASLDEEGVLSWSQDGEPMRTEVLAPELDRLHREIQRLLNYYRSLFPERSYEGLLDRVSFSGGPADMNGVARYFAKSLRSEVVIGNPFHSFASRLSPEGFSAIKGHEASFSVAIGLALGELHAELPTEEALSTGSAEFVWRRNAA